MGLGVTVQFTQNQQAINTCDSPVYWVNPFCWRFSRAAWSQMAALPPIPASVIEGTAPIAPDWATSAQPMPVSVEQGQADTQAASDAAVRRLQQNVQDFVNTLPDEPIPDVPCTFLGFRCLNVALIGGAVALGLVFAVGGGSPRRYGR